MDPSLFVVGVRWIEEQAQRALAAPPDCLRGREGQIEVVYVATFRTAALSSEPRPPPLASADTWPRRLAEEVRTRLGSMEPRWHFNPFGAATVAEDAARVADELRSGARPDANHRPVVGGLRNISTKSADRLSLYPWPDVDRFPTLRGRPVGGPASQGRNQQPPASASGRGDEQRIPPGS